MCAGPEVRRHVAVRPEQRARALGPDRRPGSVCHVSRPGSRRTTRMLVLSCRVERPRGRSRGMPASRAHRALPDGRRVARDAAGLQGRSRRGGAPPLRVAPEHVLRGVSRSSRHVHHRWGRIGVEQRRRGAIVSALSPPQRPLPWVVAPTPPGGGGGGGAVASRRDAHRPGTRRWVRRPPGPRPGRIRGERPLPGPKGLAGGRHLGDRSPGTQRGCRPRCCRRRGGSRGGGGSRRRCRGSRSGARSRPLVEMGRIPGTARRASMGPVLCGHLRAPGRTAPAPVA
jgi:hypothetical protein